MHTKLTTATLLSLSTETAAYAAGPTQVVETLVITAPAPLPAPLWEGAYIGAQVGYAYGDFDFDDAIDGDDNGDGIIGGLTFGYL